MAKLILFVWIFFPFGMVNAQPITKHELHELFFKSGTNPLLSGELYNKLRNCSIRTPLIRAYKGISEAMLARNTTNIYKKYKLFLSGRDTLEQAIKEDIGNFEIRFLRFQFQSNIPSFLGYNTIPQDKRFLLENLISYLKTSEDKEFTIKMFSVLSGSKYFTTNELNLLKQISTSSSFRN
jgi:hypothetical protein